MSLMIRICTRAKNDFTGVSHEGACSLSRRLISLQHPSPRITLSVRPLVVMLQILSHLFIRASNVRVR